MLRRPAEATDFVVTHLIRSPSSDLRHPLTLCLVAVSSAVVSASHLPGLDDAGCHGGSSPPECLVSAAPTFETGPYNKETDEGDGAASPGCPTTSGPLSPSSVDELTASLESPEVDLDELLAGLTPPAVHVASPFAQVADMLTDEMAFPAPAHMHSGVAVPPTWTPCQHCAMNPWADGDHVGQPLQDADGVTRCHVVSVDPSTAEYASVVLPLIQHGVTIVEVQRVQNHRLYSR